jgi:ubiquitin-protein ligase
LSLLQCHHFNSLDALTANHNLAVPPQSVYENRIYSVQIYCGLDYPDRPPTIKFVTKIILPCVDDHGNVIPVVLPCLAGWKRENTIETILIELRRFVQHPKRDIRVMLGWDERKQHAYQYETDSWQPPRIRRFLSLQRARPTTKAPTLTSLCRPLRARNVHV